MTTMTKTKKPAPTIAQSIDDSLSLARSEAVARWRSWAEQLAAGEAAPSPRDILDTASILGVRDPGAALKADAQAIAEVEALEARIAADKQRATEFVAQYGGREKMLASLREAEARVAELQAAIRRSASESAMTWGPAISRVRANHPRVFAARYQGEAGR
jgi:hypothetical protein